MNIHILACGGAVMHNIAMALHDLGHHVTGSDDEIFEPALSRLKARGLLPEAFGWFPSKITNALDFIILGMHARADNPELARARELGVKIYSFPDYVFEHAKNKTRLVVAGSHGKTTTTAMIMHVLKTLGKDFDYLVGSQIDGFETMVRFSDAPLVVIEGDEYLTSTLDPVPKFLKYRPHFTQITGIAWDHINVFPTFENYVRQFEMYLDTIEPGGQIIYFEGDSILKGICEKSGKRCVGYHTPAYRIDNMQTILTGNKEYPLTVFGEHNLQNLEGARLLCQNIGIGEDEFYTSIGSFKGSARRLEKVYEKDNLLVFRDFAHSPSKLKATVEAVKQQYADCEVIAVFELHTFSSLNKAFLPHYRGSMDMADKAIVYYSPHVFELKRMPILEEKDVLEGFGGEIEVITETNTLVSKIKEFTSNVSGKPCVLLVMSSGNFDNARLW